MHYGPVGAISDNNNDNSISESSISSGDSSGINIIFFLQEKQVWYISNDLLNR